MTRRPGNTTSWARVAVPACVMALMVMLGGGRWLSVVVFLLVCTSAGVWRVVNLLEAAEARDTAAPGGTR